MTAVRPTTPASTSAQTVGSARGWRRSRAAPTGRRRHGSPRRRSPVDRRRRHLVVRGRRGGGARGRALAAAVGGDGVRRGRPGLGGGGRRARTGSSPPRRRGVACSRARLDNDVNGRGTGPVLLGGSGSADAQPDPTTRGRRSARPRSSCPRCSLAVNPDGAPDGLDRRRARRGSDAPVDALAPMAGPPSSAVAGGPHAIEPGPNGIVARPVFAPLTVVDEQPGREAWDRLVGHVRRRRGPRPDRQGGARATGRAASRRWSSTSPTRCGGWPPAPPKARSTPSGAAGGRSSARRRSASPGRRADRSGPSRSRARSGAAPTRPRTRALAAELLASEKDREEQPSSSTRSAPSWRRSRTRYRRDGARGHAAPLRPAPRDRDHRHAARGGRACSRSARCSTRRRRSGVRRATSRWRSSTSTRASTAAGTPARSAGSGPTATASCGRAPLRDRRPHPGDLFAGCGIVADSDPAPSGRSPGSSCGR